MLLASASSLWAFPRCLGGLPILAGVGFLVLPSSRVASGDAPDGSTLLGSGAHMITNTATLTVMRL